MTRDREVKSPWRPPTRRVFVAMIGAVIGAAAATLAARRTGLLPGGDALDDDRPPSKWTGTTRWIGHC